MISSVQIPPMIRIGGGACTELPLVLSELGVTRPLIVTDPTMVAVGHAARLASICAEAGIVSETFSDTVPEPTASSIDGGVAVFRAGDFDAIVALGGGSAIDSAKAIAVLAHLGGTIRDYAVPKEVGRIPVPVIAVPTTAGTGSECTRFTVITDDATDEKLLCRGAGFLPAAAIVDYEFTLTAPRRLTADTGIDALTHAIEAYVSRRANDLSDDFAQAAMARISRHIERACDDPADHEARAAMMTGATLAGMAFSNASVALVHGMSRPVGALFHVPHGLSNAMLLPCITRFSIPAASARYAHCARVMGWAETAASDEAACASLVDGLQALNRRLQVPGPAEFGIGRDAWFANLERMASQAEASGSPANNPRIPTQAEMVALYTEVWGND
ncbi:MAG TPA: iron-containing alcohol dehydrogenase [Pseudomonadales bacterium]|nr:iron-containing alcohol dehydrogenase [Pseudomonadales bacterium]